MKDYLELVNQLFPTRKTESEKTAFRKYCLDEASNTKFPGKVDTIKKSNNIVFGDLEKADCVFTAHYDTPATSLMPNLMTPTNKLIGMLYHLSYPIIMALLCLAVAKLIGNCFEWHLSYVMILYVIIYLSVFYLCTRCFKNKHNKNDNTSGVACVLSLMEILEQDNVAFILFDNEEKGLVGSKAIVKHNKALFENKLVINMDCVGLGDKIIVSIKEQASKLELIEKLKSSFVSNPEFEVLYFDAKKTMGNSDQKSFPCGVGVYACKYNKIVGYYTSRIHTNRDTLASSKNIEFISLGLKKFIEN